MDGKQLPEAVEQVRSQFAQWRAHKSGRDRIPERLWHAAVEAARRHGVHAVSRAVRLEHAALRRRLADGAGRATEAFAFVELDEAPATGSGCVIDLEKQPPGHGDQGFGLRWAGVLAVPEALEQGAVSVVAGVGGGSGEGVGSAGFADGGVERGPDPCGDEAAVASDLDQPFVSRQPV